MSNTFSKVVKYIGRKTRNGKTVNADGISVSGQTAVTNAVTNIVNNNTTQAIDIKSSDETATITKNDNVYDISVSGVLSASDKGRVEQGKIIGQVSYANSNRSYDSNTKTIRFQVERLYSLNEVDGGSKTMGILADMHLKKDSTTTYEKFCEYMDDGGFSNGDVLDAKLVEWLIEYKINKLLNNN